MRKEKILVTGGIGSIGVHVVEHILKNTDWQVVILDIQTDVGNLKRLDEVWERPEFERRTSFVYHDLRKPLDYIHNKIGKIDYVIHLAAETDVEKSQRGPLLFAETNVIGTVNLLEYVRHYQKNLKKYIQVSTDEVFGSAESGVDYKEWDRHKPSNPYSASKAAADDIAYSYFASFKLPIVITHSMNNFGEMQQINKFVTRAIHCVYHGKTLPIHGMGGKPSKRKWLHSRNHASALLFLLKKGMAGEKYNIVGNVEMDVATLAQKIANIVGKPLKTRYVEYYHVRPGHDFRYSLNGTKLAKMGWKHPVDFEKSLEKTIIWTLNHPQWMK